VTISRAFDFSRFKLDRPTESLTMIAALLNMQAHPEGRRVYLTPRRAPAS